MTRAAPTRYLRNNAKMAKKYGGGGKKIWPLPRRGAGVTRGRSPRDENFGDFGPDFFAFRLFFTPLATGTAHTFVAKSPPFRIYYATAGRAQNKRPSTLTIMDAIFYRATSGQFFACGDP